ncbi:unnamed protein product, partial [Meganyctiphanes norvegica]
MLWWSEKVSNTSMPKLTLVCVSMLVGVVLATSELDLWTAAKEGDLDGVAKALNTDVDPNWRNPNDAWKGTALHVASANNHPLVVQALLDAGADMNIKNKESQTPIFVASGFGHTDVVTVLITHCIDVKIPKTSGTTARTEFAPTEVATALTTHGTDVPCKNFCKDANLKANNEKTENFGDTDGVTVPTHGADVKPRHIDMETALTVYGTDISITNSKKNYEILDFGNTYVITALKVQGSGLKIKENNETTVKMDFGHTDVVTAITVRSKGVNIIDNNEMTVTMKYRHKDGVTELTVQ